MGVKLCQECLYNAGEVYASSPTQAEVWVCRECIAVLKEKVLGLRTRESRKPPKKLRRPSEPVPMNRTQDKNALCPCGSGRKYRQCCKGRIEARLTTLPMTGRRRLATARAKQQHPGLDQVPEELKGSEALLVDKQTGETTRIKL
jgi:hypothetical protein